MDDTHRTMRFGHHDCSVDTVAIPDASTVPTLGLVVLNTFIVIFYLLFDVRILNVALYVSRRGMYACVRRWAICVRPRGV